MAAIIAAEANRPGTHTALLTITPSKASSRRKVDTPMQNPSNRMFLDSPPFRRPLAMAASPMRGFFFKNPL